MIIFGIKGGPILRLEAGSSEALGLRTANDSKVMGDLRVSEPAGKVEEPDAENNMES